MIHHHPLNALLFFMGIALTLLSPWVALRALVYLPLVQHATVLPYLLGLVLINLLFACDYFYQTQASDWFYILAFVVLYISFLCWQTYYAILTIPENHWGTR
jgi:hyaluronan synthase